MTDHPRRFQLVRTHDVSGVSGTGVVCYGVEWPDGRVSTRWNSERAQSCSWDSIDDMIAVHGHGGHTVIEWLDELDEGMYCLTSGDIRRQSEWSIRTFGPGDRLYGVVEHIKKELKEIEDTLGKDPKEWIDVMILAVDGAQRSGFSPGNILRTYLAKMEENYKRQWPDWRDFSENQAIEHIRD